MYRTDISLPMERMPTPSYHAHMPSAAGLPYSVTCPPSPTASSLACSPLLIYYPLTFTLLNIQLWHRPFTPPDTCHLPGYACLDGMPAALPPCLPQQRHHNAFTYCDVHGMWRHDAGPLTLTARAPRFTRTTAHGMRGWEAHAAISAISGWRK